MLLRLSQILIFTGITSTILDAIVLELVMRGIYDYVIEISSGGTKFLDNQFKHLSTAMVTTTPI
jgi:hypothetical protein